MVGFLKLRLKLSQKGVVFLFPKAKRRRIAQACQHLQIRLDIAVDLAIEDLVQLQLQEGSWVEVLRYEVQVLLIRNRNLKLWSGNDRDLSASLSSRHDTVSMMRLLKGLMLSAVGTYPRS